MCQCCNTLLSMELLPQLLMPPPMLLLLPPPLLLLLRPLAAVDLLTIRCHGQLPPLLPLLPLQVLLRK